MEEEGREKEGGKGREEGGGEREREIKIKMVIVILPQVYLLPWQLESTHKLSTSMKRPGAILAASSVKATQMV